jgi:cyanophycinase-like exopeptidase
MKSVITLFIIIKIRVLIIAILFFSLPSYKGTLTEKMFRSVLDRGGVIGGTSAGATIQGSSLTRGDTMNNQKGNSITYYSMIYDHLI